MASHPDLLVGTNNRRRRRRLPAGRQHRLGRYGGLLHAHHRRPLRVRFGGGRQLPERRLRYGGTSPGCSERGRFPRRAGRRYAGRRAPGRLRQGRRGGLPDRGRPHRGRQRAQVWTLGGRADRAGGSRSPTPGPGPATFWSLRNPSAPASSPPVARLARPRAKWCRTP